MANIVWNYAELSKLAKACGGPEMLMRTLTSEGFEKGFRIAKGKYTIIGGIVGAAVTAVAGGIIIIAVNSHNKKQKIIFEEEFEKVSREMADRVREYKRSSDIYYDPEYNTTAEEPEQEQGQRIDDENSDVKDDSDSE